MNVRWINFMTFHFSLCSFIYSHPLRQPICVHQPSALRCCCEKWTFYWIDMESPFQKSSLKNIYLCILRVESIIKKSYCMFSCFSLSKKKDMRTKLWKVMDGEAVETNLGTFVWFLMWHQKSPMWSKLGWKKKIPISNIFNIFSHVSIMVAPSELIMASLSTLFPFPFPPIIYPPPTPPTGSGMGELPVVWCLRPVVGTSIPQRTQRSCSMTRRPWWMGTRSSSAWRRPGASCPFLSSPSSTISTGE